MTEYSSLNEHPAVSTARKAALAHVRSAVGLEVDVTALIEREHELVTKVNDLNRRVEEETKRAKLYEQRNDEYAAKVKRHDKLDKASTELLEALDRLPLTMEDAGLIPGAVKPAIPLYGTYDWQAVMAAKLALRKAMKDG